jgi:hypothetical protein
MMWEGHDSGQESAKLRLKECEWFDGSSAIIKVRLLKQHFCQAKQRFYPTKTAFFPTAPD